MHDLNSNRYDHMPYNRCGRSGLLLPALSLGLWQNFGESASIANAQEMVRTAFDLGITHFDLANNYGPPNGSAEITFGQILRTTLAGHRDELVIATKAGYRMWPGPYGEWGSRKYLIASLDQSLKRLGVDYVDIFYSHRFDPQTPLEETMRALDAVVRQGKALYVGISSYDSSQTRAAVGILRSLGTPIIVNQPSYSLLNRWVEDDGLFDTLEKEGTRQHRIFPVGARIANKQIFARNSEREPRRNGRKSPRLNRALQNAENFERVRALDADGASSRGQSLAQMALVVGSSREAALRRL